MNGTPTREEIDKFIDGYNLRMKWNADIRKAMDKKFIADNEEVKDLIDDWIPTTIISEEDNDLLGVEVNVIDNNADTELYEYTGDNGNVIHELHTFSVTDCHHAYYRYATNENEEEYKKRRVNFLLNDINKILDEYNKRISEMTKQTKIFTEFKKMILNQ